MTGVDSQPDWAQVSARGPLHEKRIDPNNPPWGVPAALLVWLMTFLLLGIVPVLFVIPYATHSGLNFSTPDYPRMLVEFALRNPTAVFLQVLAILPTHLLTFAIVWLLVTGLGKRPFWATLGWSWGRYLGLWSSIGAGVALFLASALVARWLGGDQPTPLDQIINSSRAARYMLVFLATLTAPFAEEFIYRGVLYSALQRLIGSVGAVLLVVALFTLVHVPQYKPNYGVIAAVGLLSFALTVIRALSGRLLPCFIVHLVFNGIQSVLILAGPPGKLPTVPPEHGAALILTLAQSLHSLV
jgi:membrane protease YdiL (CAAX protease family)